jgi:hypothetical protein
MRVAADIICMSLMVTVLSITGIRFVLNDAFTNMRAEERQQLLHVSMFNIESICLFGKLFLPAHV